MKISLIIPMYNVEKYIEKCLLSCINQDLPNNEYEIIIINDGSPDRSLEIAEKVAASTNNIVIISQKNSGLSAARNKGLSIAKGDYIWFIDSDDTIKHNCLNQALSQCYENNLDVLAICAGNCKNNEIERRFSYNNKQIESGISIIKKKNIQHCAPFYIYKRSFLEKNNLSFYNGIYHEDSEWSPRVHYFADRIGYTNEILYFVTVNPNSITRVANPKKGFDCLIVGASLHGFYKEHVKKEDSVFFHNYISLILNNALSNFANKNIIPTETIDRFKNAVYNSKDLFHHLRNSSIMKYRVEGYLFQIFPHKVLEIYQFLQKLK